MSNVSETRSVAEPPHINPYLTVRKLPADRPEELWSGLRSGDRSTLARCVTLIESDNPDHGRAAEFLLDRAVQVQTETLRIGITGPPGVGKSSLIEVLGQYVLSVSQGSLAVLAVDPSSRETRGSIMADKSRMTRLAQHPRAYLRPTPAGDNVTGIANTTQETIFLCESFGAQTVFVETVGVGQVETAVSTLVDCFLYLQQPGSGDDLQGIKRGALEHAHVIAVTKADGNLKPLASLAVAQTSGALSLFQRREDGWRVPVLEVSSLESRGVEELWSAMTSFLDQAKVNGAFEARRQQQLHEMFTDKLLRESLRLLQSQQEASKVSLLSEQVASRQLSARHAIRLSRTLATQADPTCL